MLEPTIIGTNRLYLADMFDIMPMMVNRSVDVILTDLPYGTTNCHWDTPIDLPLMWEHFKRILKPGGVVIMFAQTPFDKVLGCSNLPWLRYEWIWEKTQATGHLNANRAPMKAHENILVFYDKIPVYNPIKTFGHKRKVATEYHKRNTKDGPIYNQAKKVGYDSTERFPRSVQVFKSDKQKKHLHNTQKPEALVEYLVRTYTNPGFLVMDCCMGSNTTGAVCNKLGIEKYPDIFKIATDRLL